MEKKKRSFNVIDAVMIAAVVAALAALAYGIISGLGIGRGIRAHKVRDRGAEIRSEFCQKAAVGDVVRSSDGSSALGEWSRCRPCPHATRVPTPTATRSPRNRRLQHFVCDREKLTLRKRIRATSSAGETLSAKRRRLFVRLPSLCFGGECVSVETVKSAVTLRPCSAVNSPTVGCLKTPTRTAVKNCSDAQKYSMFVRILRQ